MDEILGIVRNRDIETRGMVLFEKQHALVDPVEAIGFGSGPIVRADRPDGHAESRVFEITNHVQRRVVVRVGSDKEVIVAIVDGGGVVLHHSGQLPHARATAGQRQRSVSQHGAGLIMIQPNSPSLAEPGPQAEGVQCQVVQAADQDDPCQRKQAASHTKIDIQVHL